MSSPTFRCRVGLLTALTLFEFGTPRLANAQSSDANARARAAAQEGARLIEQNDYEGALARFQAAYGLVPSPKLHYNFGLVYLGLARKPDALESFELFLRETPNPPPLQKLKATQHVDGLRRDLLRLSLSCNVDGAKVIVDGRLRGSSPLKLDVALEPGPHDLLVEADAHEPHRQSVNGAAGQTLKLAVDLKPAMAKAAFVAAPPAAPADLQLTDANTAPPEARPLYTRGWFWGAVAVVAIAAAAGAYFVFRSDEIPSCPPGVPDGCLRL